MSFVQIHVYNYTIMQKISNSTFFTARVFHNEWLKSNLNWNTPITADTFSMTNILYFEFFRNDSLILTVYILSVFWLLFSLGVTTQIYFQFKKTVINHLSIEIFAWKKRACFKGLKFKITKRFTKWLFWNYKNWLSRINSLMHNNTWLTNILSH